MIMEKIERDFQSDEFSELDDVLDRSFFNNSEELVDLEEDEYNYDTESDDFRLISEL
tara:strand:- start:303 stop:473 length:171 start_codon:yes stop_codon:yes gene_type:complete